MIKSLEVWNFKKIEHTLMAFDVGLTAMKGANEQGKSSRYHAIAYAFFGARALPLSLAETVTWGKPESSLKVRLVFEYSGNEYVIERAKSGAQLFCKTLNLLVSGQAEVTKYVESLFGVNADTAGKLTVASQNALRGALEDRSAVPLIEKLANISLIDELIHKIQEQLPCGSTKSLEAVLEGCADLTKPYADFTEIEEAELEAGLNWAAADDSFNAETTRMVMLKAISDTLSKETAAIYKHNSDIEQAGRDVSKHTEIVAKPLPEFEDSTADLEAKVLAQSELQAAQNASRLFNAFKPVEVCQYTGSDFKADLAAAAQVHYDLNTKVAVLKSDLRVAAIGRINDEACTLCGKLLQDVAEVVAKNAAIDAKIDDIKQQIVSAEREVLLALVHYQLLEATKEEAARRAAYFSKIINYVVLDEQMPPSVTWGGASVLSDSTDYKALLRAARQAQTAYQVALAQREAAKMALQQAQNRLAELGAPRDIQPIEDAKNKLEAQRLVVSALQAEVARKLATQQEIKRNLDIAKAQYAEQVKVYESALVQVASIKNSIKEYDANNALIKRLREVRPIVAAQLWAVVLTAVSRYFSEIRGTKSNVTVLKDNFLIDGRPAEAYSGSTLDSLGLAIRMALAKTFLPNLDFLLLDEPAAGMDDEREAAMLGVLAAANFKQVVVVTHSTIADSFAAQVIQI